MIISIQKYISSKITSGSIASKIGNNLVSQGSIFTGRWVFNFTLAKLLPPALFGIFTLAQALGNFLMNLFSFGAVAHLIDGISSDSTSAYSQLRKSISLTLKITVIISIAWITSSLLHLEIAHLNYFLWSIIIGLVLSLNVQLFGFFKGLGEFEKEAKSAVLFCIISCSVCLGFWTLGLILNVSILLGAFLALQSILFIKGYLAVKSWVTANSISQSNTSYSFFKERLPFGLHEIQGAIYIHVILLILGFMVSEADLGMYRSIQLFITPVSLLPSVFSQVTMNRLSALKQNPTKQIKEFRKFLLLVSGIGIFFFSIYSLVGARLINYVYDDRYNQETVYYIITCFSAAFLLRFISSNYGVLITSAGKQSVRVLMTFLSIIVSVVLTYTLTKEMGVKGAALAGAASFGVIALGYSIYCEAILIKQIRKKC